ncbi:MAG: hypothetical protein H6564_01540 [Lewinellaceae bacterium]|nr:hypothetical protein [Lewinellaceae bacterium]
MRNMHLWPLIMIILSILLPDSSFCQGDNDYAEIYFYRPKQSIVSGGVAVEIKVSLNGRDIGTLLNKTKIRYRLYSQGSIKLRCAGSLGGSGIGSPYVETINFQHGKEYHVVLSFHSVRGVSGEILSANKGRKMKKKKYADETELEEDRSNPILEVSDSPIVDGNTEGYADLYFYRPKQSMMKGGVAVELKISLNDKEIGSLLRETKMRYRLYSQGPIKMKCMGVLQSGGIGSPFTKTIDFKHGKEYHVVLSFGSAKGVTGEMVSGSKAKKMKKKKFADFTELEEDRLDPVVGGGE